MTTNQTIDGVPRGRDALVVLIESFRDALHRGKQPTFSAGDLKFFITEFCELRALLDAPIEETLLEAFSRHARQFTFKNHPALPAMFPKGYPWFKAGYEAGKADQPHGEPVAWTEVDVLDFMSVALRHAEYSGLSPSDILDGLRFMAEKGKPAFARAEQPAPAAVAAPDRIKGMVEAVGGEYAVMIDPDNRHFGWTFKRHPDGHWVSGRKATDAEMSAARSHAHITNQL